MNEDHSKTIRDHALRIAASAFVLGQISALYETAEELRSQSASAFVAGQDNIAQMLRDHAANLDAKRRELRDLHDTKLARQRKDGEQVLARHQCERDATRITS